MRQKAVIISSGLPHSTPVSSNLKKSTPNCYYYLQRSVTPDWTGNRTNSETDTQKGADSAKNCGHKSLDSVFISNWASGLLPDCDGALTGEDDGWSLYEEVVLYPHVRRLT